MSLLDDITTTSVLYIFSPFICLILCFYIWWIALYQYQDEFVLGILLVLLGLMYACTLYLVISGHPNIASSMIFVALIIIITIAAVSGLKQQNGDRGGTFLCLGITPLVSGICFTGVAAFVAYGIANKTGFTSNVPLV